jgi:hypothetical protein
MMTLLDDQLRWLMLHGYMTWHCHRCKVTHNHPVSAYYHLVDTHGLDPQSAFREGEGGEPIWSKSRSRP